MYSKLWEELEKWSQSKTTLKEDKKIIQEDYISLPSYSLADAPS